MIHLYPVKHPDYTYIARWKEGKEKKRKYFTNLKKAQAWAAAMKVELAHAAPADDPISPAERAAVMMARREGVDLDEAVRSLIKRRLEEKEQTARAAAGALTVGELMEMKMAEARRSRRSERYMADLQTAGTQLLRFVPREFPADAVTREMLDPLVYEPGIANSTSDKRRVILYGFWQLAVRRRLLTVNPASEFIPLPPDNDGEVDLLQLEEAQALWCACLDMAPDLVPALAIQLWAGVRVAELQRLTWEAVRPRTGIIQVAAHRAKTRQRRQVKIEPPLRMALEGRMRTLGPVWPANGDRLWDAVKAACGWRTADSATGRPWPHNGLRHSWVSYHLEFFENAGSTALQAGHSEDMLFRHYRDLVTADDAAAWWSCWTPDPEPILPPVPTPEEERKAEEERLTRKKQFTRNHRGKGRKMAG